MGTESAFVGNIRGDDFMAPSYATHVLRLTVRVHVGSHQREADLSLPVGSSLADALPEILELCSAPQISRPWRASSAAGVPIDQAVALHRTPLEHGSVVVLTPAEPVDAPIIRDSAEALAAAQGVGRGAVGAAQLASAVGAVVVAVLLSAVLDPPLALAAAAAVAVVVLAWRRKAVVLAPTAVALGAVAAAWYTAGGWPTEQSEAAWAVFAGLGAGAVIAAVTVILGALPARLGIALSALGALAAVASGASFLPSPTAAAGAVVLAGLVSIMLGPGLVTRWAGLDVPTVPTAGQDLGADDGVQHDSDARAARAGRFADGLMVGIAAAMVPAVLRVGWSGGGWAQALCLAVAGAVVMHAARHRSALPAWSLSTVGIAACIGVVLAAVQGTAHPFTLIVAGLVVVAAVTAVVWAPQVSRLEPTTIVWWERAETVAVIAALPLAINQMGVFAMIRGLG